jgi:hypothetical protein
MPILNCVLLNLIKIIIKLIFVNICYGLAAQ